MYKKLLRKKSILLISIIFVSILLILFNLYKKKLSDLPKTTKPKEKYKQHLVVDQCLLEWEQLNQDAYFRRNLAFYYSDIKRIRLYFEMNARFTTNFNLQFNLNISNKENNDIVVKKDINGVSIVRMHTYSQFTFGFIEAGFDLSAFIQNPADKILTIKVTDLRNNQSTQNSIDLQIKHFNTINDNKKKHSVLCGKNYYHTNKDLNKTEWWIKINKINGFDKMVLLNNSYGNGSWKEYENLFLKYKDFVQIIQYQCLPNFISGNHEPKFFNFFDTWRLFNLNPIPYQQHFEYSTFNECLLLNKDEYKYVAIIDDDEAVLPRKPYNNELNEDLYTKDSPYPEEIDPISNKPSKYIPYFNNLRNNFNLGSKASLGFKWAASMKHKHMNLIFNEIEKMLKSTGFIHTLTIEDKDEFTNTLEMHGLKFRISIQNEDDYKYAKYLYEMHLKYIEPFLAKNSKQLELVPEPYNRFYYFNGGQSVRYNWYHKYIHDASETQKVSTHMAENSVSSSLLVPVNYGHLTHFRHEYREPFQWNAIGSVPIRELYFDFVYFNNYFKPIFNN